MACFLHYRSKPPCKHVLIYLPAPRIGLHQCRVIKVARFLRQGNIHGPSRLQKRARVRILIIVLSASALKASGPVDMLDDIALPMCWESHVHPMSHYTLRNTLWWNDGKSGLNHVVSAISYTLHTTHFSDRLLFKPPNMKIHHRLCCTT